jgi:choline dehydrogenase-like flavoprotein
MSPHDLESLNAEPTLAQQAPRGTLPDDPECLPEGSVVDGSGLAGIHADIADFVVVGSGAAGGVAAWTLAEAGWSVIVVEEGPWVRTRQFQLDVNHAFKTLYRWGGTGFVTGRTFLPLLQGMCVGGSTTINSAIAWRLPDDVYDDWASNHGLGSTIHARSLEPCFDRLEDALNVHPVDEDVLGRNSGLMREGMTKLGIEPHTIERYEKGCRGSARCAQGCPNAAKLSTALTCIPWTLSRGGRIFTNARVVRVTSRAGKATGIDAITTGGGKLRLMARRGVILAASTIQSPNILRRSGIKSRALGNHFMAHPGVGLGARYDDDVCLHRGATQGMETIHFRRTDGFKLESLALSPELTAVRIPGFGKDLLRRLADFRRIGLWGVQVRAQAVGKVDSFAGSDRVRYTLLPRDIQAGKKGLKRLGEIAFATGAKEVWPGIHGLPEALRSVDELRRIDEVPDDPRHFMYIATHLFGAARMGPDPRTSVVGLDFCTHDLRNLFVVDSSIFPTNLGVNPQHAIMGIAMLAAQRIGSA